MKSPSLAVNMRSTLSSLTGVQRYAIEVFESLSISTDTRRIVPCLQKSSIVGQLWEQLILPWKLGKGELLWSPANVGPIAVKRQVVTIHDAATFDHPEWFRGVFARWYRFLLPWLAKRSEGVITVSHDAKLRLVDRLGVPAEKIRVIWNGVSADLKPAGKRELNDFRERYSIQPSKRYFAYIGSLEPRKNLERMLTAWRIADLGSEYELLVAGSAGKVFSEGKLSVPPRGCRMLGRIPDKDLAAFLSGAYGFLYPSLYEGFGLPPLEAMACGVRVAISDIPVLREVSEDFAIYFDPTNPNSIAAKIRILASEESVIRAEMINSGMEHARTFTWERSAAEHLSYFEELRKRKNI